MKRLLMNTLLQLEGLIYRAGSISSWLLLFLFCLGLWIVSPILAVGFLALLAYSNRPAGLRSSTHGSACWATFGDLQRKGCILNGQGIFLGRAVGLPKPRLAEIVAAEFFYPLWRSREARVLLECSSKKHEPVVRLVESDPPHLAVYAASGMGKSTAFAIPTLLEWADSVVCLDAKGELFEKTARMRARRFGQQVISIDPFGITGSHRFGRSQLNVLSLYRGLDRTLADEARRLANALVIRTGEEKEPFWNDASQVLIQTVLSFLLWKEVDEKEATLNRLRDILTNPKVMSELLAFMSQSEECFGLFQRLAGQVAFYQGQTQASIYSVANTHLEFLDSAPIADVVQATNFDPHDILDGKMSIYLSLPIDRIQEMAGLQRIYLTSLINLVFQAGENRHRKVLFLLDEAATLGQIDSLYSAVNYGRGYGVRCFFLFQSVSQVENLFPREKAAAFRGTVASCFAGVNDLATAKEVSEWIGQTTIENVSTQTSSSWGKSKNASIQDQTVSTSYNSSQSTTRSESGRPLIQAEEVLQLPKWAAILLLPGTPPVLLRKVPYFLKKLNSLKFLRRVGQAAGNLFLFGSVLLLWSWIFWAATIGKDNPHVRQLITNYQELKAEIRDAAY